MKHQYLLPRDRVTDLRKFVEWVNTSLRAARTTFGFRLDMIDDHLVMLSDQDKLPADYDWVGTGHFRRSGTVTLEVCEFLEEDRK